MEKQNCNKLIIFKDKNLDENNLMTYHCQWFYNENLIYEEIRKVDENKDLDIDDIIDHKKQCCLNIESIDIQHLID